MDAPDPPSAIQINRTNLALLEQVGAVMQQRFPHLWGDQKPTHSTIVGFLASEFLSGGADAPRNPSPASGGPRPVVQSLRASVDRSNPPSADRRRQVYVLRGSDGKLRGTWHVPSYEECPGRAAFQVQHPNDDYSLVDFDEVARRRLKQCAFCARYERGEV